MTSDVERVTFTRREAERGRRRFECPHCHESLPTNEITECNDCGAHLEMLVRTRIPPTYEDDAEDGDDE
mgnify:CR=1 FL=1